MRSVEKYVVDYVKYLLKAKQTQAEVKFRALLILKDLMNNKHKILVDYSEKKILRRLYEFGRSEFGANVLMQTNPAADPKTSADFYQLVLECLDTWGTKYGNTNPLFQERRYRLIAENKLPIKTVFVNHPGPDEEYVYNDASQINEQDIENVLREVRSMRELVTTRLLQSKASNFKTWEMGQLISSYRSAYNKLETHPDKNTLVNDMAVDPRLEFIKDELLNELIYYQSFSDLYSKAVDTESNKNFYMEFKSLNKNIFNDNLNVEPCLLSDVKPTYVHKNDDLSYDHSFNSDNLTPRDGYREPEVVERPKLQINNQVVYKGDNISDNLGDYNYDGFKADDDENYSYDMNDDRSRSRSKSKNPNNRAKSTKKSNLSPKKLEKLTVMTKENQELHDAVEKLEQQKKELAQKIKAIELERTPRKSTNRSTSYVSTPVREKTYANEGLMNIMRTKEEQIQLIQDKIKKLEEEHNRLDMPAEDFVSVRPVSPIEFKNKSRTRSHINVSTYRTEPRTPKQLGNAPLRSDTTGTQFVDQLYTDINRVLNKSSNRQAVKDMSYVY